MERLTDPCWKNLDPWECCGQDKFCNRDCHEAGGCTNGCIVPKLYVRVAMYEDAGLELWQADAAKYIVETAFEDKPERAERIRDLMRADKEGRVVVLPCKVGERWVDEDGRAVRITAVIVSMEPFGENINIYFDYEDATPDDAGSDCMTNWYHFSRTFTCAETVLDNRKDADND